MTTVVQEPNMLSEKTDRQNQLTDSQKKLYAFVSRTGPIDDEVILHTLVYLAQALGTLDHLYEFSFSHNMPISSELSSDLYDLIQHGLIVDTHKPGTIYVNPKYKHWAEENSANPLSSDSSKWHIMEELCKLEEPVILTLYRISKVHNYAENTENLINLLTKKNFVYPQYAEKAVNFCVERDIFELRQRFRSQLSY